MKCLGFPLLISFCTGIINQILNFRKLAKTEVKDHSNYKRWTTLRHYNAWQTVGYNIVDLGGGQHLLQLFLKGNGYIFMVKVAWNPEALNISVLLSLSCFIGKSLGYLSVLLDHFTCSEMYVKTIEHTWTSYNTMYSLM